MTAIHGQTKSFTINENGIIFGTVSGDGLAVLTARNAAYRCDERLDVCAFPYSGADDEPDADIARRCPLVHLTADFYERHNGDIGRIRRALGRIIGRELEC